MTRQRRRRSFCLKHFQHFLCADKKHSYSLPPHMCNMFHSILIHIIRIRLESIKVIFHVESIANENNNRNTCALAHYVDACILLIYNIYQYSYAMMISWVAERRIKHLLCNVYNTGSFNCGKYYYY